MERILILIPFISVLVVALIVVLKIINNKTNDHNSSPKFQESKTTVRKNTRENTVAVKKGARGENSVSRVLGGTIEDKQYLVNDIIVVDENGKTSQIDHVFVNKYGIWVIETKNYAGFIYGNESQREWTQVLAYGKTKNKLYNPIKQNGTHIYILKKKFKTNLPFYSLIVFIEADISNVTADNVINIQSLRKTVWSDTGKSITLEQMKKCYNKLIKLKENSGVTIEEHIENVNKMQKDIKNGICPRCGGKLVLRKGENGDFYGCANFPKCKFTKKIDG